MMMCMSTTTRTHHCRDALEVIESSLQHLRIGVNNQVVERGQL
jgi:hypothetical protein